MRRLLVLAALAGLLAPPALARAGDFSSPAWAGPPGRLVMGGTWLYRPDPADAATAATLPSAADTAGWAPVSVPNAWNATDESAASDRGGVGWYRKDFAAPDARRGLTWFVRFESVNYRARVWLNGRLLGAHAGAYLPWELRAAGLKPHGTNRLVVRVDSRRGRFDLPPGPGGGWWNYGGLLREVELRRVARIDIPQARAIDTFECPRCVARVAVRLELRSYSRGSRTVRPSGSYGAARLRFPAVRLPAGGRRTVTARIVLDNPVLWSPAHPHLYRVRVRAGATAESFTSGLRTIEVRRGRLYLNGHALHLRGVGLHEDDPLLGAALTQTQRLAFLRRIEDLGARLVRSHYPLHPAFQELADRAGILLWSEIPVYQLGERALARPAVRGRALGLLRSDIETNANHPSVLAWSVGNELPPVPGPGQRAYLTAAARLVHRLDPTRPAAYAFAGFPAAGCHPRAYGGLGLLGVNDYFGWYTRGGGIADRDDLPGYLAAVRRCYRRPALMVTEVGAEANREGPVEEKGTYAFQADFARFHFGVFARTPWLAGGVWWALNEFRVAPGWAGGNPRPSPPLHTKGLVSFGGVAKPAFDVLRRIYRATRQY